MGRLVAPSSGSIRSASRSYGPLFAVEELGIIAAIADMGAGK